MLNSARTIVGLPGWVKRLPVRRFPSLRGEGDRRQGCTDPRGGTLGEDHVISLAAGSHIGMKGL